MSTSPSNAAVFSASTSASRTSNSSPSRSTRPWTSASKMKQSLGQGENASVNLMIRSPPGAVDHGQQRHAECVDRLSQLPCGPVAPLDNVGDGTHLGKRDAVH